MGLNGPTKLKEADITKVDFVIDGAQQDARILLFKSLDSILADEEVVNKSELIQGTIDQFTADILSTTLESKEVELNIEVEKGDSIMSEQNLEEVKEVEVELLASQG